MPHWVIDAAIALVAIATFIGTVLTQRSTAAEMRGATGQRLTTIEGDVTRIEADQDKQWAKIGEHGERISRLEGQQQGD